MFQLLLTMFQFMARCVTNTVCVRKIKPILQIDGCHVGFFCAWPGIGKHNKNFMFY